MIFLTKMAEEGVLAIRMAMPIKVAHLPFQLLSANTNMVCRAFADASYAGNLNLQLESTQLAFCTEPVQVGLLRMPTVPHVQAANKLTREKDVKLSVKSWSRHR